MACLSEQTVLLMGATGSIGTAIARELASEGALELLRFVTNRVKVEELAAKIGQEALCFAADLADPAGPTDFWSDAQSDSGRIHRLIDSAGVLSMSSIDDPLGHWPSTWSRDVQVNSLAAADLCRSAVSHVREYGDGKIINMASRAGQGGHRPDAMSYGATKATLINLTQSMAGEFGQDNVTATALAQGWIRTEMSEAFVAEHGEAAILRGILIDQWKNPMKSLILWFLLFGHHNPLFPAPFLT